MPDLFWSPPAEADLDRIAAWLDDHRGRDISADRLEAISQRAQFLIDFPHGGRPYKNDKRVLVVSGTSYVIIYRICDGLVEIIRVHHARENWQLGV